MKKKHRHPVLPGWALGLLGILPAAAAFWFLALPGACPSDGTSSVIQSAGSAAEELLFGILPFPAEPEPPAPDLAEAQPPKEAPVPESTLRARALLEEMSPEDKVGQMFIARYPAENAAGKASTYRLGGYILFARDFENRSPKQAAAQIQACQDAAGIPMLIAVDEEGGKVNRVSRYPAFRQAPFPSSQVLYENGVITLVGGVIGLLLSFLLLPLCRSFLLEKADTVLQSDMLFKPGLFLVALLFCLLLNLLSAGIPALRIARQQIAASLKGEESEEM